MFVCVCSAAGARLQGREGGARGAGDGGECAAAAREGGRDDRALRAAAEGRARGGRARGQTASAGTRAPASTARSADL